MKKAFLNIFIYIFFPSIFIMLFTNTLTNNNLNIYLFISYILMFIYFILIYRKKLIENIMNFKIKDIGKVLIIFILGLSLMMLSNYIINYLIIPNGISNNELGNRELLNNNKIIYSILLCFIIPIIEEIVFRLELKNCIKNKYLYLILSSLIFSLLHNISDTKLIELLYIIPYFILGFTFSYTYYKTDNIYYSMISHSLNNLISVIVILFF